MTKQEADFIGSMNMCDEISNEAYKKIMCNCEIEESQPITSPSQYWAKQAENFGEIAMNEIDKARFCEDCISRENVLDYIAKLLSGYLYEEERERLEDFTTYIAEMPSLTPQPTRWIPCSERLPEEMGTYMTTVDYEKHGLATGQRYYHGQGLWEDDCVIAWMPLPEPYKAESEGEE